MSNLPQRYYDAIHKCIVAWMKREIQNSTDKEAEEAGDNFVGLLGVLERIENDHQEN